VRLAKERKLALKEIKARTVADKVKAEARAGS
jgi:hypothetical protein